MHAAARQTLWVGAAFAAVVVGLGPVQAQQIESARSTLNGPGALPFSEAELQQALLARLFPSPSEPGPQRAQVDPSGPGVVSVRVGDRTRSVTVGDRTGSAAARVVALVIADLLSEAAVPDEKLAVAPSVHQPVEVVLVDAGTPDLQALVRQSGRRCRLAVTVGASRGTDAGESVAGTLNGDLVITQGNGRFNLAPSVGLTKMPTRNAGTMYEVSSWELAARMLVGFSRGPVDVLAGPLAAIYSPGGATSLSWILFGGEVMARVAAPLSRRLRLTMDARVDGWANRMRVTWADGRTYTTTPRIGIGGGIGLAWDWP